MNQKLAELMRVCANRSYVCSLLILPQGAPRSVLLLLPIILFLSLWDMGYSGCSRQSYKLPSPMWDRSIPAARPHQDSAVTQVAL